MNLPPRTVTNLDGGVESVIVIGMAVGVRGDVLIVITKIATAANPRVIDARIIFLFIS
jgi:hypothetical protein